MLVNHDLGIACHTLGSQTNCHCISGYTAKMVERTVTLCRTMQRPDHDHHPRLPAACQILKGIWIRRNPHVRARASCEGRQSAANPVDDQVGNFRLKTTS